MQPHTLILPVLVGLTLTACTPREHLNLNQQVVVSVGEFKYPEHLPKEVTLEQGKSDIANNLPAVNGKVTMSTEDMFRHTLINELRRAGAVVRDNANCMFTSEVKEFSLKKIDDAVGAFSRTFAIYLKAPQVKKSGFEMTTTGKYLKTTEKENPAFFAQAFLKGDIQKNILPQKYQKDGIAAKHYLDYMNKNCKK